MPLTAAERKRLLPYGAGVAIARALKVDKSFVTKVMANEVFPKTPRGRKTVARVRAALAKRIGKPVDDVFPEAIQEAPRLAEAS